MNRLFVVLVSMQLLVSSCEKDESHDSFGVSGFIMNGGLPVENAFVNLDGLPQYEAHSNAEGYFEIKNVPSGNHRIHYQQTFDNTSYVQNYKDIEVSNDLTLEDLFLPDAIYSYYRLASDVDRSKFLLVWGEYEGDTFWEYKVYKHNSADFDETTGELIFETINVKETNFSFALENSSETYFRLYVKDKFEVLAASETYKILLDNPVVVVGEQNEFYINPGQSRTLYFDATENDFYTIEKNSTECLMDALHADLKTYYFQDVVFERLPKPILVSGNERVYIKIRSGVAQTFRIRALKLDKSQSLEQQLNVTSLIDVEAGVAKLLHFNVQAGKQYKITYFNTKGTLGEDGALVTKLSVFWESSDSSYYEKNYVPYIASQPARELTISSSQDENIFLVVSGGMLSDPAYVGNTVSITVTEL